MVAEDKRREGGKIKDDALDSKLNQVPATASTTVRHTTLRSCWATPTTSPAPSNYIDGFSANVRRIFDYFEFSNEIERMDEAGILFLIIKEFCEVDLHPNKVKNDQMGLLFENLIRRFNELANETAGDHFTPREVIT